MKIKFDVEVDFDTCVTEMNEITIKNGLKEIIQIFSSYAEIGIMPRIGEEIIPMLDGWEECIKIASICYCNHKIMVQCEFS